MYAASTFCPAICFDGLPTVGSAPNTDKTLSQHLAELENRVLIESALWSKISSACAEAGLPTGDDAPDYIVAPISSPAMSVFQLSSEPPDDSEQETSAGFIVQSAGEE